MSVARLRILVTGATGFVGRHVLTSLLNDGVEVYTAGRTAPELSDDCASRHFFVPDIGPDSDWSEALTDIDVVVHLAGLAHIQHSTGQAGRQFEVVNTLGTERLARDALAAGVKRFVFVSSIAVYGCNSGAELEHQGVLSPVNAYGRSKAEAEKKLLDMLVDSDCGLVIVRPPLVYGPEAPGNFGALEKLVRTGIPLPLASVDNARSFLSVWNLAEFIKLCCFHDDASGHRFLVKDDRDLSTPELISLIARSAGATARLFPFPVALLKILAKLSGKYGIYEKLCGSLVINDSHARNLLDWSPPVTASEGIRRTFSSNL